MWTVGHFIAFRKLGKVKTSFATYKMIILDSQEFKLSRWMTKLPTEVLQLPLNQLAIPGRPVFIYNAIDLLT